MAPQTVRVTVFFSGLGILMYALTPEKTPVL
jgi:hypothetical protein